MNRSAPVLVIGLDGATWDTLLPWVEEGSLPVLGQLLKEGVHGKLESVIPPVTCPAWRVYSTGKNPGKLGVFWWAGIDFEGQTLTVPNSRSFKSLDLWDYLSQAGYRIGVINMPTTYPPQRINGFMVAGFGTPMDKQFDWSQPYTWPAEFQREIEEAYNYQVGIPKLQRSDKSDTIARVHELIDMRFDLAEDKLREGIWHFLHVTVFYINIVQHYYGLQDPAVKEIWRHIDDRIGSLLRIQDGFTFLISDHGSAKIKGSFLINAWLRDRGDLHLQADLGDRIHRLDRLLARRLGWKRAYLAGGVRSLLPSSWRHRIPNPNGSIATNFIDMKINWPETRAVGLSQGPIYLNHQLLSDAYTAFRDQLIEELEKITDPMTGERLIRKAYRREDIYTGKWVSHAPDIVIVPQDHYEIYGGLAQEFFQTGRVAWTTGNHPLGIFLAHGPGIRAGASISGCRIIDVAPTILHLMNVAIPRDMDGHVLEDIFDEASVFQRRPIVYQDIAPGDHEPAYSPGEEAELRRRLEDLGYLG